MLKSISKFCLTVVLIFGLNLGIAVESSSFSFLREDGSLLEGYFLPSQDSSFPILFALQGSTCKSSFDLFCELEDYIRPLGLGLVTLEK